MSVYAIRAFTTLNLREPQWPILKKYYKTKFAFAILWATEYSSALVVLSQLNHNLYAIIDVSVLTLFGVIFELYFAYCIYSCVKLGENGRLVMNHLPVSVQNIRTDHSEAVHVAREFKEVIAYPANEILPMCEEIQVVDFTKNVRKNSL